MIKNEALATIKQSLFCADCKNCKVQMWATATKLDKITMRGYLVEREDLQKFYLVRCMWLKDNVIAPEKMEVCEGKVTLAEAKQAEKNKNTGADDDDFSDFEPDFGDWE